MDQIVQVTGAVLILIAFVAAQFRLLETNSMTYLALNLVGSVVLAVSAYADGQWGFLLLEGVWALVTAWGMISRGRTAART